MAERCGFNKVGMGVGTGENKSATRKAHKPTPVKPQEHGSIGAAVNRVKGGQGKVHNDTGKWPVDYSKAK